MRPASIVQFERVYLASFVFEAVTIALGWSQLTEKVAARSKIPTNVEQGILIGAVAAFLFLLNSGLLLTEITDLYYDFYRRITMERHDTGYNAGHRRSIKKRNDYRLYWV